MLSAPAFTISHPRSKEAGIFKDVRFVMRALSSDESIGFYAQDSSSLDDFGYITQSFVRCCLEWTGILENGTPLPCTEANKLKLARHPLFYKLVTYLLNETETLHRQQETERAENLDTFLKLETGQAFYTGDDRSFGIDSSMPFRKDWCCHTPDNVWELHGDEPPCHICPKKDATLTPLNVFAYQRWLQLDYSGRSRGMQEEPLREEAITMNLERYQANHPTIYETVLKIETTIFGHRLKKREESRKREERKSKAKANMGKR